ncbi:sensor histidine kinase [Arenivirga flava]|nr:histidine kinase [Arenivirga flava]
MRTKRVKRRASPLTRMHRYTTWSLLSSILMLMFVGLGWFDNPGLLLTSLAFSVLATVVLALYWAEQGPRWIVPTMTAAGYALWWVSVLCLTNPLGALPFALGAGMLVSYAPRHRLWWALLACAIGWAPLVIVRALGVDLDGPPTMGAAVENGPGFGLGLGVGTIFAFVLMMWLNRYAWNISLELEDSRQATASLAVMQERFRFAADLHDIQGHTLHVIRLKARLADRLLERDPAAARQHLAEIEGLVAETLAETRSLAYGQREVSLRAELANSQALFEAAGIRFTVHGAPPEEGEELLGLVVREGTTNILRHAQASRVDVRFGDRRILLSNDGAADAEPKLRGLARLGERFRDAGGALQASVNKGVFTTEASLAGSREAVRA